MGSHGFYYLHPSRCLPALSHCRFTSVQIDLPCWMLILTVMRAIPALQPPPTHRTTDLLGPFLDLLLWFSLSFLPAGCLILFRVRRLVQLDFTLFFIVTSFRLCVLIENAEPNLSCSQSRAESGWMAHSTILYWLLPARACEINHPSLLGDRIIILICNTLPMWRCWTRIFLVNASSYGGIFMYCITPCMPKQLSTISLVLFEIESQRCWPKLNTTYTKFFSVVSSVCSVRQKSFSSVLLTDTAITRMILYRQCFNNSLSSRG
jgi:hypothetical protein